MLTLFSAVMITLGSTQPLHPTLRGFVESCENVPQPCWYGIVPGETTAREVRPVLVNLGYQGANLLRASPPSGGYQSETTTPRIIDVTFAIGANLVMEIELRNTDLRIGDVLTLLGAPTGVDYYSFYGDMVWVYQFERDDADYRLYINVPETNLTSFSPVQSVILRRRGLQMEALQPWHGFTPVWRYCQLEPDFAGCSQ